MNYDEQVSMFKSAIPIGVKSTSELIELLKAKVDIKEITQNDLFGYTMKAAIFNANHCILNESLQISPNDMSFIIFRVIQNEKSILYYNDTPPEEKFVYAIFEIHTGYTTSNSNQLFLDLELARGVSQQEYDTEGDQFRSLISHLAISYCEKNGLD